MYFIALLTIITFFLGFIIWSYNQMRAMKNRALAAWSDIDVFLKQRHDLIPNLVQTVSHYAQYEKSVLEQVTQVRQQALKAIDKSEMVNSECRLSMSIPKLFALAENYPDLKADQLYIKLQDELVKLEEDLAQARRYYNAVVRDYHNITMIFPHLLIANFFAFKKLPFFQVASQDREVPEL